MKRAVTLALLCALPITASLASDDDTKERVQKSKEVIKAFATELKGEMKKALKSGGPGKAIEVCNTVAPNIAQSHSEKTGWEVSRTSLKTRNPANAPDAWEKKVLEAFEERKAKGEDVKTMAFYEVVEEDGKKTFRFMKAIPTAEKPCLMCHGANIKPEIAKKLDALYPEDQARGYQAGDIRGAFSIRQPM